MIEGKKVKEYFDKHPEARAIVESSEIQFRCWSPEFGDNRDLYWRKMTIDDVRYITIGGWFGVKGVFAWYYPEGAPHYMKIGEETEA